MSGFQIVGIIVKTVIGIAFTGAISLAVHLWPAKFLFDALRFNIFKCLNSFFYLGFINEKNYFMDTLKSILKLTLSFLIYICSFIFVFFDFDLEGNWQNNLLLCVWFIASIGAFLVPYLDLRFKNISAEKIICNFAKFFDDNYNQKAPRKNTKDETVLKAVGKVSPSLLEFKDNIYEVVQDTLPTLNNEKVAVTVKEVTSMYSYTDEQIRSFTSSYNSAFLIIKDYNNGMIIPSTLTGNDMLYQYIVNSFYICLGWCVFHANIEKKQMVFCEIDRFVDDLEVSAPENLRGMTSTLKFTYRNMSDIMLRYKKNNIDPSYLQDSSKENYNKLISEFLEYVCKISKIEWYDGIVEDFKHCMDE